MVIYNESVYLRCICYRKTQIKTNRHSSIPTRLIFQNYKPYFMRCTVVAIPASFEMIFAAAFASDLVAYLPT